MQVDDLVLLLIHQIVLLFGHIVPCVTWFLVVIPRLHKKRVLVSSSKHNLVYQSKVLILSMFVFLSIFLFLYAKTLREGLHVRLIPH